MQRELKSAGNLLDENGHLVECGYATSLIKKYDRKMIKANKYRIKEWDYYLIYNDKYGVAITVDDNSYMGLNSFSFLDFENKKEITKSPMKFFTMGKTNFPSSSEIGDVRVENKKYKFEILNDGKLRTINVFMKNFINGEDAKLHLELFDEPKDSMVIATPFAEKKTAFYYNQKIIGLKVKGSLVIGDKEYLFDKESRGILDWGRGVWTYKNTWYWGAGCGVVDGHEVGFNIGYGFGDTSQASENMIFYDGKAHKLEEVSFNIPKDNKSKDDFMKEWTFTSSDKRFECSFTPLLDRHSNANILVVSSNQHQVFGLFNGSLKLDNGKEIKLKNFMAFAEKVVNKW